MRATEAQPDACIVTPINHLSSRIDALSWRDESTHESDELRRLAHKCGELERAIELPENELLREVADMEAAKSLLRRMKSKV